MTMNSGPCFDRQTAECLSCTGQAFVSSPAPRCSSKFQVIVVCYSSNSKPNPTQPLFDVTSKEFTSRLSLDWKYTFVDNRIMLVLGYQPSELVNKSVYSFIHHEDLENIKVYHEMLVRKGRINTCYYRFLTKGEVWIWLRSCCHISYNQWNSKPEYVTVKSNPVHYEEVFSNQEVLVKNDRLHFQSISRDFRSESCIKVHSKRADSPLSFAGSEKPKTQSDEGNINLFSMLSDAKITDKAQQENESKSLCNDTSVSSSFSNFPVPEGLSPTQYKLHVQLQGKHELLEQSIKNQITELQKIKRQIDINKQLWEFNRQLQEKKALKMGKGPVTPSDRSQSSCSASDNSSEFSTRTFTAEEYVESSANGISRSSTYMAIPESAYLTLDSLDDNLEPSAITSQLSNSASQVFAPLQPYNYFQFQ